MIPEFGHFALIIALLFSLIQAGTPALYRLNGNSAYLKLNHNAAYAQIGFVILSFFCLLYAFITKDFSVAYVAENANTHLPLFYRLTALWGAHEGSMLLWVTVLGLWTFAVTIFTNKISNYDRSLILAVLGGLSFGFILFILTTSDPFARLLPNPPLQGQDLNPLLQDPGLAMHPPMLYMGYVGFAVAFAFAIAALIKGEFTRVWAKQFRFFVIGAWCFLTLGITLGSWWSYRVLGWGGWWFWDPVENASFLPWLVGTALIHSLLVTEKRQMLKNWTLLLAICTFSLSLIGTFLVRSGILVSVHAFAVDPNRGKFILTYLFIVIAASLGLYAFRAHKLQADSKLTWFSRESFVLFNNLFLFVAMLTVLLGTLYPLIIQALGLGKISVGAPYFNSVFVPLMLPLFFLMGLAPLAKWRQMQWRKLLKSLVVSFVCAAFLAILFPLIWQHHTTVLVTLAVLMAFWIVINSFFALMRNWQAKKKMLGMFIAHVGLAISILGVTFASSFSVEKILRMQPGDQVKLASYQFVFKKLASMPGPNYQAIAGVFNVFHDHKKIATLMPERKIFQHDKITTSEVAIKVGLFRDLYIALGEPLNNAANNSAWAVRIYYKPGVRWIWYGGLVMLLGGLVALYERRRTYANL
ncbi:MAG: heme lyase CcmF/NrfE family subunit [Pseudomonadota bacterium]